MIIQPCRGKKAGRFQKTAISISSSHQPSLPNFAQQWVHGQQLQNDVLPMRKSILLPTADPLHYCHQPTHCPLPSSPSITSNAESLAWQHSEGTVTCRARKGISGSRMGTPQNSTIEVKQLPDAEIKVIVWATLLRPILTTTHSCSFLLLSFQLQ